MNPDIDALRKSAQSTNQLYQPQFFRLSVPAERNDFDALVSSGNVQVFDELYNQLKELIKSRNPHLVLSDDDYKRMIHEHLDGMDPVLYGVWVYYPWSARMVHLLDEAEFIDLRTSANRNKITTAERDILATKKVGVIGLSVGQSVSVTLALERGCGELRLADFDTLELNNLNRIRTGVHNLGLLKAYAVAREIAEIDPFFKVVCYTEGINDDNIDDFFLKGGKLDAVIDECDGVNIKILCRIKAKELHVPVLMEASDRGTLDVERFDLDPGRPVMHGWLSHLNIDMEVLRNLKTNEEKVPYMLPISGLDTLSARMKASMIEMRSTISTWPQLATAVTLGGAVSADTCRRIFLDQFTDSGRYFIDMEQLVPDKRPKIKPSFVADAPLSGSEMEAIAGKVTRKKEDILLSAHQVTALVEAGCKAPSQANSQPWKWFYKEGCLYLFDNCSVALPFSDIRPSNRRIALGAAIENVMLAAANMGFAPEVDLLPLSQDSRLVAVLSFSGQGAPDLFMPHELANAISTRATIRSGNNTAIGSDVLDRLADAACSVNGVNLAFRTSPADIQALADICGPAERLKLLNPAGHFEFFQGELKWTNQDAISAGTGIDVATLGLYPPEELMLKMIRSEDAIKLVGDWNAGRALEYLGRKVAATTSVVGMLSASSGNMLQAGQAFQRMWLTAAVNGLALQPLITPLVIASCFTQGSDSSIPQRLRSEYDLVSSRLNALFPVPGSMENVIMFRLGVAGKVGSGTVRRPLSDVLILK